MTDQRIPRFRQIDPSREELQYSRFFAVVTPDGQRHTVEMHYIKVKAGYWRVKAGVDPYGPGEKDLGAFESWEVDGNEAIILVSWVPEIGGRWDMPFGGGVVDYMKAAGLAAFEVGERGR